MHITFLSLFPEDIKTFFLKGLLGKAYGFGHFSCDSINIRDFAEDKHKKVDDYPFGDHRGMLLKADVISKALESIPELDQYQIIVPCPKGPIFNQDHANTLSQKKGLVIIAAYYEGIDERLYQRFPIQRYSIGDVVLSSGELPALIMAEATLRLIPGVVGKKHSVENDSIISGLLEHAHYTQPREFDGLAVPEQLVSGHHGRIEEWKQVQSLKETLVRRPDILANATLSDRSKSQLETLLKQAPGIARISQNR